MIAVCAMLPNTVDRIVHEKEAGISETQVRQEIVERYPAGEYQIRALGAVNVLYSLPNGSDYWTAKQQIFLTCNNKEIIRGYQHSHERAGRRARSGEGFEQHRELGTGEAWDSHP